MTECRGEEERGEDGMKKENLVSCRPPLISFHLSTVSRWVRAVSIRQQTSMNEQMAQLGQRERQGRLTNDR